jgi:hypothetical protein
MPFLLSLKVGARLTAPVLMIATLIPGEVQASCRPFAWPANSTFGSYRSYQCMGLPGSDVGHDKHPGRPHADISQPAPTSLQ